MSAAITMKPPVDVMVGQRCNVSLPEHEPKFRLVTKAHWKKKAGALWYYWYWEPVISTESDCGYSGVRMDPP